VAVVGTVAEGWGLRTPILCVTGLAFLVWIATMRMREHIATPFAAAAGPT
jgi:hypothetical protein